MRSNLAIKTRMMLRLVFVHSWRRTKGPLRSVVRLIELVPVARTVLRLG
jgi:hypothetical protein